MFLMIAILLAIAGVLGTEPLVQTVPPARTDEHQAAYSPWLDDLDLKAENTVPDTSEDETLAAEWDTTGYFRADIRDFEIPPNSMKSFFENVEEIGMKLRGAFFVAPEGHVSSRRRSVTFSIIDPDGELVHEITGELEALFSLNAEKVGRYSFVFTNNMWITTSKVTFVLDDFSLGKYKLTPTQAPSNHADQRSADHNEGKV